MSMNYFVKIALLGIVSVLSIFVVPSKIAKIGDEQKQIYSYAVCVNCDSSFNDIGKCRVCNAKVTETGYLHGKKMEIQEDDMVLPLIGALSFELRMLSCIGGFGCIVEAILLTTRKTKG